jgi:ectoine hydroxylase-related dioxygenase (phytanoyl-CoA dioxygenase family)
MTRQGAAIDLGQYRRDGYCLIRGLLDVAGPEAVLQEARRVFLAQMLKRGTLHEVPRDQEAFEEALFRYFSEDQEGFVSCANQSQYTVSLQRLGVEPRIIAAIRELGLTFPILCKYPTLYFNSRHLATKEHYWRQGAHQDWRFLQGSLDSMVVWVPLVPISRELGALELLPGSHRLGLRADVDLSADYGKLPYDLDDPSFVPIEAEPGDVLFFSTFLIHRSGTNSTRSIRWSCHFRFNNALEPTFVDRQFPSTFRYKPRQDLITPGFPSQQDLTRVFG